VTEVLALRRGSAVLGTEHPPGEGQGNLGQLGVEVVGASYAMRNFPTTPTRWLNT
jgi:hypothetical protein